MEDSNCTAVSVTEIGDQTYECNFSSSDGLQNASLDAAGNMNTYIKSKIYLQYILATHEWIIIQVSAKEPILSP